MTTKQGTCIQIKVKSEDYERLQNIAEVHDITVVRLVRLSIKTFLKLYKEEGFRDSLIAGTLNLKPSNYSSMGNSEQDFLKSVLGIVEME